MKQFYIKQKPDEHIPKQVPKRKTNDSRFSNKKKRNSLPLAQSCRIGFADLF
jgi:hypothetical protein